MKASERQRLELALQAAANIAPIQFHIRFSRFSPAIFALRVSAALAVCGVVLSILFWGLCLALVWSALVGLLLAYGFYRSPLSAMVWPRAYMPDDIFKRHNLSSVVGDEAQSQIVIDACMFPQALAVQVSTGLSDIEELDALASQLQPTLSTGGPIEAIVKAVELSLLAVLPIAATMPPLQSASTVTEAR